MPLVKPANFTIMHISVVFTGGRGLVKDENGMQVKERWMLEKKLVQQVQRAKAMPQPVPAGER